MTKNQIEYWNLQENKRANLARELETNRANRAREGIDSSYYQGQLQLRSQELGETRRSNLSREAELYRSNVAREMETHRSNVVGEGELHRHNLATEMSAARQADAALSQAGAAWMRAQNEATYQSRIAGVQEGQLVELNRHNRELESWQGVETMAKSNLNVAQGELARSQADYYDTQAKVLPYTLNETQRHNLRTEDLTEERNKSQVGVDLIEEINPIRVITSLFRRGF